MRDAFANSLAAAADKDDRVYIVVADISPVGPMAKFRENHSSRFINVGVAEQTMIGVCAGLALRGMRPFAYTIATFALYRPFEMIRDDLCYQRLPVTVVGMGAGVIYSTLGSTHHSQEDIAVAGAIPNMQIISPCDPLEVEAATHWCAEENRGPVYMRIGKAGEPVLTRHAEPWRFGKMRYLRRGTDVCILTHGVIAAMAVDVADGLRDSGLSVSLAIVHTLKPVAKVAIASALHSHSRVIVIEEHAPQGGLASITKQLAWDSGAKCKLDTFTLRDEFVSCYGGHADILSAHGLSVPRILAALECRSAA